jgi:hypothetical protein
MVLPMVESTRLRPPLRPSMRDVVRSEVHEVDRLLVIELAQDTIDEYFGSASKSSDKLSLESTPDAVNIGNPQTDTVPNELPDLWEDELWIGRLGIVDA